MQIVPRQLGKLAVRQEFRLHVAGCGIERRFVEINHTIEESRCTDEIVEDHAIGIDRRSIVPRGQEVREVREVPSCAGLLKPNAEITVAPYTLMPFACSLPTTSL